MHPKHALALAFAAAGFIPSAVADPVSGDLFYTRYSGSPNVKSVSFTYNGVSTFTLGTPTTIGTTLGADGIVGNPQNSDLLIVGGQGPHINTISKSTGIPTVYASPASVFHLAAPDSTTLLASGIPGSLARHTILAGGAIGPGTLIGLGGSDTLVTTIIDTPAGFFYTSATSGGFGSFGTITFNAAVGSATSATTNRLLSSVGSAHGGAYDPFTGDIMLFGDGRIGQYDISTGTLIERPFGGMTFDQGAVDAKGHMFVASNSGHLLFMDYTADGSILGASTFATTPFLDSYLDDVAPLIGSGGTAPPTSVPDSGSTLLLLAGPVVGLLTLHRRRRS